MTRVISCASVLLAVLTVLGPIRGHAAGVVPDYVAGAIADPARPPAQVARDAQRQPAEVLAFAGVRPGDRVADFMSGGAYFTRLFSRIVGNTGHVYAFLPEEQLKNCAPEETAGTRAVEHDGSYANVSVMTGPVGRFRPPEPVDLIWTSLNFHDLYDSFMGPADVPQVMQALFDSRHVGDMLLDVARKVGDDVAGALPTEDFYKYLRDEWQKLHDQDKGAKPFDDFRCGKFGVD